MSKAIQKPVPKLPPAIFSELDQNLWWAYRNYAVDELTSIDTYLHEASKDVHLTSDIYENLKLLYKALGLHHHPFLNVPIKRTISPEAFASIQQAIATWEANSTKKGVPHTEKPEMPDCEYIEICNIKIDPVVLKLLVFCWGHSKISTLKLMRNQFEPRIEEILADTLTNPNFRLNKLFLDWNPPQNFANYLKILNNINLQFLSLRSNELTDLDMESLSHALRDNTSLKCLDLYGNRITGAGVQHLSNLSDSSCCLESISLAKNSLGKWEDVQSWFDKIGKFPLTSAEVEEYRHKEKEREAAIQKNQKNKGKKGYVEEPVIFLYPIVQSHDGNWFLSKSPKIKMLSLALNTFDETSLTHFDKFLSRQDEDFSLILSNNGFKHDDLEALQQTHCSKIIV